MSNVDLTIEYCFDLLSALDRDPDFVEDNALIILHERDVLEEIMPRLTDSQKERVQQLDDGLVNARDLLAVVFPNPKTPISRWWWYLREGPQVRQRAESKAA